MQIRKWKYNLTRYRICLELKYYLNKLVERIYIRKVLSELIVLIIMYFRYYLVSSNFQRGTQNDNYYLNHSIKYYSNNFESRKWWKYELFLLLSKLGLFIIFVTRTIMQNKVGSTSMLRFNYTPFISKFSTRLTKMYRGWNY